MRGLGICFLILCSAFALAGKVQNELNSRLKGSWVILETQVGSSCDSMYTNNKVNDNRVVSGGSIEFPPGEIGQIKKVDLKRSRVDVLISLETPYRVSWNDGPFQLFDQRTCQIEMQVELPREMVKNKLTDEIEAKILLVMEAFPDKETALESSGYNDRETEPYPPGYERTLAEYEQWKREQVNKELLAKIEECSKTAVVLLSNVMEDPQYSRGFTQGIQDMMRALPVDCDSLRRATYFSYQQKAKVDERERGSKLYARGYEDGQKLTFNLLIADRLKGCLL